MNPSLASEERCRFANLRQQIELQSSRRMQGFLPGDRLPAPDDQIDLGLTVTSTVTDGVRRYRIGGPE